MGASPWHDAHGSQSFHISALSPLSRPREWKALEGRQPGPSHPLCLTQGGTDGAPGPAHWPRPLLTQEQAGSSRLNLLSRLLPCGLQSSCVLERGHAVYGCAGGLTKLCWNQEERVRRLEREGGIRQVARMVWTEHVLWSVGRCLRDQDICIDEHCQKGSWGTQNGDSGRQET